MVLSNWGCICQEAGGGGLTLGPYIIFLMGEESVVRDNSEMEFAETEHSNHCWPHDWTRNQWVMVVHWSVVTPLLAAYLHPVGRQDSATCPHYNGADETAEHLVLHCPAHEQARRECGPNLHYQSDLRHPWSFLEKIRVVTRRPDRE